jgi:putative two-component system response regulator
MLNWCKPVSDRPRESRRTAADISSAETPASRPSEPPLWTWARELRQERCALVLALTRTGCWHDDETPAHLRRVQRYARCLAEAAARTPSFAHQIDAEFMELIELAAALHDLGKVGVPRAILSKPGPLDPDERRLMESHTVLGYQILEEACLQTGGDGPLLIMAKNIARWHHERFDGTGYPDGLRGVAIPLEARIVAIADVYDALRAARAYKSAWPHGRAVHAMMNESPGHFDPVLLPIFSQCASQFADIFDWCSNES